MHAPITIQRSVIFFLFYFFFVQRWHRTDKALYISTAHASITIRYYYTRSKNSKWPEVLAKCQVRWTIITAMSTFSNWIRVYTEKLVNATKSHKIEYAPMHTIRVITRLAQNARRTDRVSASISCEHCLSSRNNPHYAPRHIIYYYISFLLKDSATLLRL